MTRTFIIFLVALAGCARSAAPVVTTEPTHAEAQPITEPRAAPPLDRGCIAVQPRELLDVCRASGVDTSRAVLPLASAEALETRAENAQRAEQWSECAELFTELSEVHPDEAHRQEASAAAMMCLSDAMTEELNAAESVSSSSPGRRGRGRRRLTAEEQDRLERERFAPRPMTSLEVSLEMAYARYLCVDPDGEDVASAIYRRARLFYVANHWEEAALLFRDFVDRYSDDELAPFAANQYLDCLNVLARLHPERRDACREELASEVERFLVNDALMEDEELRNQLVQLRCAILWQRAEQQIEDERYREGAELFLQIYAEYGEQCDQIGSHDLCEVLYNAAMGYESARCLQASLEVRRRLIETCGEGSEYAEAQGMSSQWARRALYQAAGNEHALGQRAEAARDYEEFARRWAGEEEAPEALSTALGLRLGLGQGDEALADARLYEKNYGRRRELKRSTASVVFAAGVAHLKRSEWTESSRYYDSFLRRYAAVARPDELIRAQVALGSARLNQGSAARTKALDDMRRAVALADEGATAGADDAARLARYQAMASSDARDGQAEEVAAARLALLIDAVARAREALGADAPERALAAQVGMSTAEAWEVLTFARSPEGAAPPLESCTVTLPDR